jgi:hypothetical protein
LNGLTLVSLQFKCCGVENYTDFEKAKKWQREYDVPNIGLVNLTVPIACCILNGTFPNVSPPDDLTCATNPTSLNAHIDKVKILQEILTKVGDLYSAYPALLGGSKALSAECVTWVKHSRRSTTIGAHVLLPFAVNSTSERKLNALPCWDSNL